MSITTWRTPADLKATRSTYVEKLQAETDDGLREAAEQMIWLSAYASNNPRSDYHWQADAVYDECQRRGKGNIYNDAHKKVSRG